MHIKLTNKLSKMVARRNPAGRPKATRLVDENGWEHYVYQADESSLHITLPILEELGWRYKWFANTTQVQDAVNTFQCSYLRISSGIVK